MTTSMHSLSPGWRVAQAAGVFLSLLTIAMGFASIVLAALNQQSLFEILSPSHLLGLPFSMIALLVFSQRPANLLAWIFLGIGSSQAAANFANSYAEYALVTSPGSLPWGDAMSVPGQIAWFPGLVLFVTFLPLLYPTGRLLTPRWRFVAWASALPLLLFPFFVIQLWPHRGLGFHENSGAYIPSSNLLRFLGDLMFPWIMAWGTVSTLSLIVRFRRAAGIERDQLKWITYATALTISAMLFTNNVPLAEEIISLLVFPIWPSVPVAAGIAILRHRLFDIDLIIRRTLIYGVLSASLALTYFGSVALIQRFTPARSQVDIVVSTLAIAALFQPLRRRIQGGIDRRFYRRRYDGQQALTTFNETVRGRVDLPQLSSAILHIVYDTFHPASASLWLANPRSALGRDDRSGVSSNEAATRGIEPHSLAFHADEPLVS